MVAVEREIGVSEKTIEKLEADLAQKEQELQQKQEELEKHQIFSTFLEEVVESKQDENWEFEDIDALKNRFYNLRSENDQLKSRKNEIDKEIEETRVMERDTVTQL